MQISFAVPYLLPIPRLNLIWHLLIHEPHFRFGIRINAKYRTRFLIQEILFQQKQVIFPLLRYCIIHYIFKNLPVLSRFLCSFPYQREYFTDSRKSPGYCAAVAKAWPILEIEFKTSPKLPITLAALSLPIASNIVAISPAACPAAPEILR